ncbi:MAG: hypothetical protein ACKOYM_00820, partial [Actinomycetes bacterium]
ALTPAQSDQLQAELNRSEPGCEVLDTTSCLLPFPSDAYTKVDGTTGTGRRVNIPAGLLANVDGATLDPTEWNRNDGFSPSTPIIVHVPGLDPARTKLPPEGDVGASLRPDSATVLMDLDTGQMVPHWAEVDLRATSAADSSLLIRPAVSLIETHRFAVGLRNMVSTSGVRLQAPVSFQVYRDNHPTKNPVLEARRSEFDTVFETMAGAGVNRADLYLAWYFTVASADSLAGRVLSMRDDAFGRILGGSPKFTVSGVSTSGLRTGVARVVRGTFQVPLYLNNGGAPGSRMVFSPLNGDPLAVGAYAAPFTCVVPKRALQSGEARPVVYGHGLLGDSSEVTADDVQDTAVATNSVYCATNWIGLSSEDMGYAVQALGDINKFPSIPDRLQQSLLNPLFLAQLMLNESGLGTAQQFQTSAGATALDTATAYYDGNSQGAIMGGAATAISPLWTRANLGVGGMGYATLLNRSVDFDEYFALLREAYPNPLDQQIAFGLMQMLWDRGETSGYVQHLTDRAFDRTPAHEVLMQVAFGDHQVAPVTALIMARTLKIPMFVPQLPKGVPSYLPTAGEQPKVGSNPFFGLQPIRKFPVDGSALFMWYSGTLAPPLGNITPTMSAQWRAQCQGAAAGSAACADPHGDPRRQARVMEQKNAFFTEKGVVINVCGTKPCESDAAKK